MMVTRIEPLFTVISTLMEEGPDDIDIEDLQEAIQQQTVTVYKNIGKCQHDAIFKELVTLQFLLMVKYQSDNWPFVGKELGVNDYDLKHWILSQKKSILAAAQHKYYLLPHDIETIYRY